MNGIQYLEQLIESKHSIVETYCRWGTTINVCKYDINSQQFVGEILATSTVKGVSFVVSLGRFAAATWVHTKVREWGGWVSERRVQSKKANSLGNIVIMMNVWTQFFLLCMRRLSSNHFIFQRLHLKLVHVMRSNKQDHKSDAATMAAAAVCVCEYRITCTSVVYSTVLTKYTHLLH